MRSAVRFTENMLNYIDQVVGRKGYGTIRDTFFSAFDKSVYSQVKDKLRTVIIAKVNLLRDGNVVNMDELRSAIRVFLDLNARIFTFVCALACGCRAVEYSPCLLRDHSAQNFCTKSPPRQINNEGGCMRSRPPLARISGHVSRGVLVVLFCDGGEMCCTQPPVTYKKTSVREPYFPSSNDLDPSKNIEEKNGTREDEEKIRISDPPIFLALPSLS